MFDDRTSITEQAVQKEQTPKISHLARLFMFAFSSAKAISFIYLGAFIILAFLRPLLAFMWGQYIQTAENITLEDTIIPAVLLLMSYFIINLLVGVLNLYVIPYSHYSRLDLVQANRQQELMHTKMYKKIASLPPEHFEIPKVNDRISQVFGFVGNTNGGMNTTVMMNGYLVIGRIVSVVSIAASLFIFNPWLCLIVLVAPLPTFWSSTKGLKMRFKFVKDNTKLVRKTNYYQSIMLSPAGKEIKTLGLHDFFYKKWKEAADEYTLKERSVIRVQTILQMLNYGLLNIVTAFGNVFAIILMAMGSISLGALGAVMALTSTLVSDMKELIAGVATVYMKKNEAAQFFDLMELPEQKNDGTECGKINLIKAENIKYRYPLTERYVLDGVSLTIRKGEKVAFVGENGMGKSTFVKLITGTLAPSEGELFINDTEINNINPISHYAKISAVVQDPARYNAFTVADNVFLGDTIQQRDENAIDTALNFVGLDDVDKNILLGKDIGGTELSGGQWQKLAIARAAYRTRDFIILDEPTSNLDPLAESEIFQKYIALSEDKTVIFVTHRISVASLADRIIVFTDGKIAQDGTHGELINQEGEYARLYKEQAKWYNR